MPRVAISADRVRYRPEIDGLRAISVLGVIAFHFGLATGGRLWLPGGFLGVDVFFVISGYLITRILLERPLNLRSLSEFYARRIRRLLPALYLVCASSLAVGMFILPPDQFSELARTAIAGISFVSNIYFYLTTDYWSEAASLTPMIHLWSLAVEEQFYLVYPALLVVLAGRPKFIASTLSLLLIASLALATSRSGAGPEVFYLSFFRAWELLAGAVIGLWHERRKVDLEGLRFSGVLPSVGFVLISAAFILGGDYTANIAAVVGAVLILGFCGVGGFLGRTLSWGPLKYIGLISYSLYLWHQPVLAFASNYALADIDFPLRLALIALCLVLAAATRHFVEMPVRRRATFRQAWSMAFLASAVLLGASTSILVLHGLPQRYSSEQRLLLAASAERGTSVLLGQDCTNRSVTKPCRIGDPTAPVRWALLGDSHAETLSDSLSRLLARNGLAAEVLTFPGCPFIAGVEPMYGNDACATFSANVLDKLRTDRIETVIIQDRTSAYILGTRFDNGEGGVEPGAPFPMRPLGGQGLDEATRIVQVGSLFASTITGLLDQGVKVIYIAPVPEVGWNVPRVAARLAARGAAPITTSRTRYFERHRQVFRILETLSRRPGLTIVFPDRVFCDTQDDRCRTELNGELLYTDTDHLSRKGAQLLIDAVAKQLKSLAMVSG